MRNKNTKNSAICLMHCKDKKGIVAKVTNFLYEHGGNILYLDQYVDAYKKEFFMRIEWGLGGFAIKKSKIDGEFKKRVASEFDMSYELYFSDEIPKIAIFVSKLPHCLYDILARWQSGELRADIPLIISNHDDLKDIAEKFGIDFHVFKKTPDNKKEQEEKELELLKKHNIDLIVLARYMQVLGDDFIKAYPDRIINIHHSFLPAFAGPKPYHLAYNRGVKIIGATSHYATSELDAGPIIEQDVIRVSHADSIDDLLRKGRDLEKLVLSRAVWLHLQRRTLVFANRTVVFT